MIPLAHTYECTLGLLAAVMSGASITWLDRPSDPPALLSAVQDLRPTVMVTAPFFIENLYRIAPALKVHPLYQFPLTRFLGKVQFPYAPAYGLTETAPLVTGTEPYRFPLGSAGKPFKGVELRLFSRIGNMVSGGKSRYGDLR